MQSSQRALRAGSFEPAVRPEISEWLKHAAAFLFCTAIASSPFLIVILSPGQSGGLFVAGYVCAVLTAPFIGLGLITASNTLFGGNWLDSLLGVAIYVALVLLISVATILWAFL